MGRMKEKKWNGTRKDSGQALARVAFPGAGDLEKHVHPLWA